MRIYIDEAGGFVPPAMQQSSYSIVLALIIPSAVEKGLFYDFLRLRDSWPVQQIEIKGSSLDETQASQVIELVSAYDAVVDFASVDMALHGNHYIAGFKSRQADAITAHINREHHPELVHQMAQLERTVRNMPNQLFIQAELTMTLMLSAVQIATLYFVQRKPEELGEVAWIVDRKGHALTEMEETWSTLILPMSENYFMKKPLISLKGADYSHFARYETAPTLDATMARHIEWLDATYGKRERRGTVINAKRLLTEQVQFVDSKDSLGIQLADMLATLLRRALNNHFQKSGWGNFGKLVVYDPKPGWFSHLGSGITPAKWPQTVIDVWDTLRASAKSMVPA